MQEIAEVAGVSQATVSRALRNHPRIGRETRTRIQRLAKEMGYRPDPYVSTLMSRIHGKRREDESPALAAIDIDGHLENSLMIRAFWAGAQRRAAALGFHLELVKVTSTAEDVRRTHRQFQARGIRGVLVLPVRQNSDFDFPWEHYSIAILGYFQARYNFHRANSDHYGNTVMVLNQLKQQGFRRIALALPKQLDERCQYRRTAAFLIAAPVRNRSLIYYHEARRPFSEWLAVQQPDVILCANPPLLRERFDAVPAVNTPMPKLVPLHLDPRTPDLQAPGLDSRPDLVGAAGIDLVVAQIHRNETGIPEASKEMAIPGRWLG